MGDFKDLKEIAWKYNLQLPRYDLVTFTFGNLSAIDRDKGVFAIKPSGVAYDELKPDDMVIVDLDNNVVKGSLRPSSDTRTHTVLYKNFPDIGAVCHTHSTYATAWAQALKPIPNLGTTHADHLASAVPCTQVMSKDKMNKDYETETGNQILEVFENLSYSEIEMVLVACHGPFTWGKSAEKTVYNAVILEELAKMALITLNINPETPVLRDYIIDKHYYRKHGENATYGQK